MTENSLREKLSLLLDEELERNESLWLLSRIETDPALAMQWRRYNLIHETMRSNPALLPDSGFVGRISASLVDEPTVLAPTPAKHRHRERAVTVALAASLAMVAVLAGKSLHDYSPMGGANSLLASTADTTQASIDPEFRDYLVTHYETAYLSGAQGLLPSLRLVSSDATR